MKTGGLSPGNLETWKHSTLERGLPACWAGCYIPICVDNRRSAARCQQAIPPTNSHGLRHGLLAAAPPGDRLPDASPKRGRWLSVQLQEGPRWHVVLLACTLPLPRPGWCGRRTRRIADSALRDFALDVHAERNCFWQESDTRQDDASRYSFFPACHFLKLGRGTDPARADDGRVRGWCWQKLVV